MSSKSKLKNDEINTQINSLLEASTQTNATLAALVTQLAELKDNQSKNDARLEILEKREPEISNSRG